MKYLRTGALLGLVTVLCAQAQNDDRFEKVREEFAHAYAMPDTEMQDSEALKTYPLYPYVEAARLGAALQKAVSAPSEADLATQKFLAQHGVEPVTRSLRNEWLRSLARRSDWPTFLQNYRRDSSEPTLRCQYLGAQVNAQTATQPLGADVRRELIEFFLSARQLPVECEPSFAWARQNGVVTPDHIEQRARLLLENDQPVFARTIATQLPPERAAPLLQWVQLLQQPESSIDKLITHPEATVESAALLAGWTKLARRNTPSALKRYDALVQARQLDAKQRSVYALQLALGLSWSRKPEALTYFKQVAADDYDEVGLAWRARAALWAGDWAETKVALDAMGPAQREETRWRYWRARVAEQTGNAAAARTLYEAILPKDNYYSAMAAARLKREAHPHPEPLPSNDDQLKAIAAQPAFVRARELLHCQLRPQALAEWSYGVDTLDSALKPQTVHLASLWGWYDISVITASQQRLFNDYELLYPRPYDEPVKKAAHLTSLEFPLIYGIIRQESLFRPDAVSPVGALGLTQLMPETARSTARRLKQAKPSRADLFDPKINVSLGAAQLRNLMDRFDGQVPVALAGYNAGPNAAQRWLPETSKPSDVWIENIPYNETREYVQRVLWHSVVFAWLKTHENQDTTPWLKPVTPPGESL